MSLPPTAIAPRTVPLNRLAAATYGATTPCSFHHWAIFVPWFSSFMRRLGVLARDGTCWMCRALRRGQMSECLNKEHALVADVDRAEADRNPSAASSPGGIDCQTKARFAGAQPPNSRARFLESQKPCIFCMEN